MTAESQEFEPLHPERLTWAVLLGRWVDFARSAVAWPDDEAGRRFRASVPDIIQLQAVCFALEELDELSTEQRSFGLDRAGVLIHRHASAIRERWAEEALPDGLVELIADAESALDRRQRGDT